jgi:hypothetical protein
MPGLLDTFKQKATAVRDYLYPPAPNGMTIWDYAQQRANDPLQPNLSSRMMQQDLINNGLNIAGMAPVGMVGRAKTQYEIAHDIASKNAEKMLGLQKGNTYIDRAKALGMDTDAYHATGSDITKFKPSEYRGASFFASKPERAMMGAKAGNADLTGTGYTSIMPVKLPSKDIEGLSYNKEFKSYLNNLPEIATEQQVTKLMEKAPTGSFWGHFYDEIQNSNGSFSYIKKASPTKTLDDVNASYRDVLGRRVPSWGSGSSERFSSDLAKNNDMGGFIQQDEAGVSVGMVDPKKIRSRFAAFDPARVNESDLLAGLAPYLGVGGLLGLGMYDNQGRMPE